MIPFNIRRYSTILFYGYVVVLFLSVCGGYYYESLRNYCYFSSTPLKFFTLFGLLFVLSLFGPAQNFAERGRLIYTLVILAHVVAILVAGFVLVLEWDDYSSQGFC